MNSSAATASTVMAGAAAGAKKTVYRWQERADGKRRNI